MDPVGRAVERRRSLSVEEFNTRYKGTSTPVVLEGGFAWPAVKKWSVDYFRETFGETDVKTEFYPSGRRDRLWVERPTTVQGYIDLIRSESPERRCTYLGEVDIGVTFPRIVDDVALPPFVTPEGSRQSAKTVLFLGRDSFSSPHYHAYEHAFLTVTSGRKRVVLHGPGEVMPKPWYTTRWNHPREGFGDNTAPPITARGAIFDCMVGEGDSLFIPVHWWHTVFGPGESVSVTIFFDALKAELRAHRSIAWRDYANTRLLRSLLALERKSIDYGIRDTMLKAAYRLGLIQAEELKRP